jgi:hypothetical protein
MTLKLYDVDAKPQRVQFVLAMLRDGLCPVSAGKMVLCPAPFACHASFSVFSYGCHQHSSLCLSVSVYYTAAGGFEWTLRCSDCDSRCNYLPQWSTVLPSLSLRTIELLKLLFGTPFPESEPAASASPPPSDRRKSVIVVEMKALKLADPARPLIEALSYGSASEVAMLTSVKGVRESLRLPRSLFFSGVWEQRNCCPWTGEIYCTRRYLPHKVRGCAALWTMIPAWFCLNPEAFRKPS